jgi:hypothetical protein
MKLLVVLCLLPWPWRMQDMTECQHYLKALFVHYSVKVPSAYLIAEGIRVWNKTLCPGLLSADNEDRDILHAAPSETPGHNQPHRTNSNRSASFLNIHV